jgi:DNA-directed RNA polymerase specialized sigma24 family protein
MNRQNHSEPENGFTPEEQQKFLKLLAQLSPEQREALKEVLKSFT